MSKQKDAFLSGEADAWHRRNISSRSKGQPEIEDIGRFVQPGMRILEIGCSSGRYCSYFSELGARYTGIDPSANAITSAREADVRGEFSVATADKLPFENDTFDLVFFGFCLYVVDRSLLSKVVYEADRVLKDKGVLAILDFEPPQPCQRPYVHVPGLQSFKMDYGRLFLAFPHFILATKRVFAHGSATLNFEHDPQERTSLQVLCKDHASAYFQLP